MSVAPIFLKRRRPAWDVTVRLDVGGVVGEVVRRVRARTGACACRAAEKSGGTALFACAVAPNSDPRWRVHYILVGGARGMRRVSAATPAGARRTCRALVPTISQFISVVRLS